MKFLDSQGLIKKQNKTKSAHCDLCELISARADQFYDWVLSFICSVILLYNYEINSDQADTLARNYNTHARQGWTWQQLSHKKLRSRKVLDNSSPLPQFGWKSHGKKHRLLTLYSLPMPRWLLRAPKISSAHFQTHDALSHTYPRQFRHTSNLFTGSISAKPFLNAASLLGQSHHQIPASIHKI